jgi:hypothetical protein
MNPDELFELVFEWAKKGKIKVTDESVGALVDMINDKLLTAELQEAYPMATPLRSDTVTPSIVIRSIISELHEIQDIYVVGITERSPVMWFSGDMQGLAYALLVFQDTAQKQLNLSLSDIASGEDY